MFLIRSIPVSFGLFHAQILCELIVDASWRQKVRYYGDCNDFDIFVKNQLCKYSSTRNLMIRSTVIVKNCLDLIFEGLWDIHKLVFWPFFYHTWARAPGHTHWSTHLLKSSCSLAELSQFSNIFLGWPATKYHFQWDMNRLPDGI